MQERTVLNPSALLSPVPVVLVSCAGRSPEKVEDRPNLITIAWAGTINSEPPMLSISVRPERHSHRLISETEEFVVNLVSQEMIRACDMCGVISGAKADKFAASGLTQIPAEGMKYAPAIEEAPVSISCKVTSVQHLGTHDIFFAKVIAVTAATRLLDGKNRLRMEDANLVAYSHGEYFQLGKYLGFYGFSVASKEALARREKGRGAKVSGEKASGKPETEEKKSPRTSEFSKEKTSGKPYEKKLGKPSRSTSKSDRSSNPTSTRKAAPERTEKRSYGKNERSYKRKPSSDS